MLVVWCGGVPGAWCRTCPAVCVRLATGPAAGHARTAAPPAAAHQSQSFTLDWCPAYLDWPGPARLHQLFIKYNPYSTASELRLMNGQFMRHLDEMDIWRSLLTRGRHYTLSTPLTTSRAGYGRAVSKYNEDTIFTFYHFMGDKYISSPHINTLQTICRYFLHT